MVHTDFSTNNIFRNKLILKYTENITTFKDLKMEIWTGNEMLLSYQRQIPNYIIHEGVPLPGALIRKHFDDIQTFNVRKEDVILAGYPRSGNHWVKEILTELYKDELVSSEKKHVYDRIPIIEMSVDLQACMDVYLNKSLRRFGLLRPLLSKCGSKIGLKSKEKFFAKVPLDTIADLEQRQNPRLYHTHLPYSLLPAQAQAGKCKIVYVMRNGKDVASSYFEMHKMYPPFGYYGCPEVGGNWKEFLYTFLKGKVCFGSWFDHILGWWDKRDMSNIYFVKYEDMMENPHKEIKAIANFLGKEISNIQLDYIVTKCSFDTMRNNRMASYDGLHSSINTKHTQFLRKGKVGDWRTKMTVEDNDFFDLIYDHKKMTENDLNLRFSIPQY